MDVSYREGEGVDFVVETNMWGMNVVECYGLHGKWIGR